jgi:hypothetical protein
MAVHLLVLSNAYGSVIVELSGSSENIQVLATGRIRGGLHRGEPPKCEDGLNPLTASVQLYPNGTSAGAVERRECIRCSVVQNFIEPPSCLLIAFSI